MLITKPLTVTAGAYTAGMSVGGKIDLGPISDFSNRCAITDVQLNDKSKQAGPYELHLFDADLAGTVTDHVAYAIAAADWPKHRGYIPLVGMAGLGANGGLITVSPIYKRLTLKDLTAVAVLVTRGAPTFAGTADLTLILTTEQVTG
jgi:hypothetical protein